MASLLDIASAQAMEALGASLAACLEGGELIYLQGPLGAGKTTLVRGLLRALEHEGPVKSPTYTLVESYETAHLRLHHFDLYRLTDPEELEYLGVRDFFAAAAVCLVEWPERGAGLLPPPDLELLLEYEGEGRRVGLHATSGRGQGLVECIERQGG
ncbi:MAG: tRNA (adenosine(37)-N6)-threonylcarbamoyltransferase complex ATPase subunit type 1 TsaE [Gammaproteobacteria bacterium]